MAILESTPESVAQGASQRRPWAWAVAAFFFVIAGALAVIHFREGSDRRSMQLSVDLGDDAVLTGVQSLALSPDGTKLVFSSRGPDGKLRLSLRLLESATAKPLAGTEGGGYPFFSPDGQWIGFFAAEKLKKIAVNGGSAVTLCDAGSPWGGSWGEDGYIVLASGEAATLFRVPSSGGTPQPVTELDRQRGERTHRLPQVLPQSQVLFTADPGGRNSGDLPNATIEVQSLRTGKRTTLVKGGVAGRYLPSGHLVYLQPEGARTALFAAPMDLTRLQLTGPAALIQEGVGATLTFSQAGTVVYVPAPLTHRTRSVGLLDAMGTLQMLPGLTGNFSSPRVSPNGMQIAINVYDGLKRDLWIYESAYGRLTRLTFLNSAGPSAWTPDGKHLAFGSNVQTPGPGLYWTRADGSGEPQRLLPGPGINENFSFTQDGKRLAFANLKGGTQEIVTLPLDLSDPEHPQPGKMETFLPSRPGITQGVPRFSPDGRWIAYRCDESGHNEVYVRPFPGPGGKWQISTAGGNAPIWSRNGRELFYQALDGHVMVTSYTAKSDSFVANQARLWSPKSLLDAADWDLMPDGKRLAVLSSVGDSGDNKSPTHAMFLFNFFDELRRRVPVGTK